MISTINASLLFAPLALAAGVAAGLAERCKLVGRIEVFATAAGGATLPL